MRQQTRMRSPMTLEPELPVNQKKSVFFSFWRLTPALAMLCRQERYREVQSQPSRNIMKNTSTEHLLAELPLGGCDTARLVLEAVEEMPELREMAGQGRGALMQALRRVLRAGIAAVREQERTVSFRAAAEESLARRERRAGAPPRCAIYAALCGACCAFPAWRKGRCAASACRIVAACWRKLLRGVSTASVKGAQYCIAFLLMGSASSGAAATPWRQ